MAGSYDSLSHLSDLPEPVDADMVVVGREDGGRGLAYIDLEIGKVRSLSLADDEANLQEADSIEVPTFGERQVLMGLRAH